ncbi:hypothetical protein SCUP234_02860 [Seiridium cupressi]
MATRNKDAVCSAPANGGPRCNSTLRLICANSTKGNIKRFDKNAMRRAQRWDYGSPEMPQATNPESSRNSCRGADQPTRTSQGQTMGSIRFEQDEGALREQASVTIRCAGVPPRIIASTAQTRGSRLFEAPRIPEPGCHRLEYDPKLASSAGAGRAQGSRVAERSAGCRELQPLASGPGLWLAVPRSHLEPRLSATKVDVDAASFDPMPWPLFVAAH